MIFLSGGISHSRKRLQFALGGGFDADLEDTSADDFVDEELGWPAGWDGFAHCLRQGERNEQCEDQQGVDTERGLAFHGTRF
jgi:hypothetical protein